MQNRQKKIKQQVDLQLQMQSVGFNLVTCGHCGSPFLHETRVNELKCPFCDFESDTSDFPDYFYEGMELSGEFEEEKKDCLKVLKETMEKYDLFQKDDEVGLALKDLEQQLKPKSIAYGEQLIKYLDEEEWELAVECLNNNDGDIIGYNPTDDIDELFQHIRGSFYFREVTEEELNQVNNLL
jgi:hypothetical protein